MAKQSSKRTITYPNGETMSIGEMIDSSLAHSSPLSKDAYTYWIGVLEKNGNRHLADKWREIVANRFPS